MARKTSWLQQNTPWMAPLALGGALFGFYQYQNQRQTLGKYLTRRPVIVHASDPFYAAAHAMKDNHIGAVLVERAGEIVGIVTDRDICLHIARQGISDRLVTLGEMMNPLYGTVGPDATLRDVILTMIDNRVRRVAVLDSKRRAHGVITLDDLLRNRDISKNDAAKVIHAQLGDVQRPRRTRSPERHNAHVASTLASALDYVAQKTGLRTRVAAEEAFVTVVGALLRRITPQEANNFLAQLPYRLRERLHDAASGPDRSIDENYMVQQVKDLLVLSEDRAKEVTQGVLRSLDNLVSEGELRHVVDQLPAELKAYCYQSLPNLRS